LGRSGRCIWEIQAKQYIAPSFNEKEINLGISERDKSDKEYQLVLEVKVDAVPSIGITIASKPN